MNKIKNRVWPCYIYELIKEFHSKEEILKELNNLYSMLKYHIKNNPKYNHLSFIMGISNIDSSTAKTEYIHTGKKGRPKKVIYGKKKHWHIHIYIISDKGLMSSFCDYIKPRLKKKNYIIKKYPHTSPIDAINYVKIQSISVRTYGDYFN